MDATYPKPIAGNWNGLPPDFETGIDAAVFREANGKSYFFKGNRYVRLTETTVDDGYASIAGNWNRLDAAFTSGIDAAMMHSTDKAIYFFKGAQSAGIVNGVPCLMSGNTPAVCRTPAHLGWEAFLTGIDAAIQGRQRQDLPVLRQVVRPVLLVRAGLRPRLPDNDRGELAGPAGVVRGRHRRCHVAGRQRQDVLLQGPPVRPADRLHR